MDSRFRARLTRTVEAPSGAKYLEGSVVTVIPSTNKGPVWVEDSAGLVLSRHEYEPVLEYDELEKLLKEKEGLDD